MCDELNRQILHDYKLKFTHIYDRVPTESRMVLIDLDQTITDQTSELKELK